MPQAFKGDVGAFRAALKVAGFRKDHSYTIYNDSTKHRTSRRLKLDYADDIFKAPQKQQKLLEKQLRAAFGERIIEMKFIKQARCWWHSQDSGKSLIVRLNIDSEEKREVAKRSRAQKASFRPIRYYGSKV
jgi:hypothetical protein